MCITILMAEKELRLNGTLLPYSTYDRLSEIDRGRDCR
uniref:Mobile element protein n=1 Tax=Klebsiella pneumoniae TaxID=573 RepID=A0A8B0SSN4_KLEPN|nr:Mobile element protein [Klebsiella pneumoniae]